jgi:astacin (peptidase family M12A)
VNTNSFMPTLPKWLLLPSCVLLLGLSARAAMFPTLSAMYWPDGIVPYDFDGDVTSAHQSAIVQAMHVWEGVANVHFRPYHFGDTDWIHIQNSDANDTPIGRGPGMRVNIHDWDVLYIMVHELGHALGFGHEQSRTDRDSYVRINWENIPVGNYIDFGSYRFVTSHYGPYDFDSVMHYGLYDFSDNGEPTITVLVPYDPSIQIGQRDHLSKFDALTMSFLYPQPGWVFVDGSYSGWETGSFLDPYSLFSDGVNHTPRGGTLWIQPGTYNASGTYNKPVTWRAPLGGVVLH